MDQQVPPAHAPQTSEEIPLAAMANVNTRENKPQASKEEIEQYATAKKICDQYEAENELPVDKWTISNEDYANSMARVALLARKIEIPVVARLEQKRAFEVIDHVTDETLKNALLALPPVSPKGKWAHGKSPASTSLGEGANYGYAFKVVTTAKGSEFVPETPKDILSR